MIKSMTAYARYDHGEDDINIFMEAKTLNSRYLDIALKTSSDFICFEDSVKKKIASVLSRGRVELKFYIEDGRQKEPEVLIDYDKAESYYRMYLELKERLGIKAPVEMDQILRAEGVVVKKENQDISFYQPLIMKALDELLYDIEKMRLEEGRAIYDDFESRLGFINSMVLNVEKEAEKLIPLYRKKLLSRISDFLSGSSIDIDDTRIAQEVALIADKSDITEEIMRTKIHLGQFKKYMDSDESSGRKLNFLLQELHREINTMGVKSGSPSIANVCVEIKSELEKLREQVQNIE